MSANNAAVGQGAGASLDGTGLNQNAAEQATSLAKKQLKANSVEERNQIRANATSIGARLWDTLDDAVMDPLQENLVLDQAFVDADLTYDLRWWQTRSMWPIRGKMGPAEHTSDLRTRSEEGAIPEGEEGIAIPYSVKDYRLYEGDIERTRQMGESIDTTYASGAGRSVAELVEDTYLWGSQIQLTTRQGFQLGCPGMLNAQGRVQQTGSGSWGDGSQAKQDVNGAIGTLHDRLFDDGEIWLLIGTEQNNQFEQDYKPNVDVSMTTREKMEQLSRLDQILHVPRMPDGEAVVLNATERVIDAARLPDGPLNIEWGSHGEMENHFKVYHLAAPRIKHDDRGYTGIVHLAGIGSGA